MTMPAPARPVRPYPHHVKAKVRVSRFVAAALACASVALVSTACGGSGKSHSTTTTTRKYGY